jgi:hypothetical protein
VVGDNRINNQIIDNVVDYTQFIRKLGKIDYFFLGFQLLFYGFIAGVFVNLFIGLSGLPYSEFSANIYGFYTICLAIPVLLLFLMFNRNRFFISHINRRTSSGFIYFSYWWRIAIPIFTALLMGYYFVIALRNFRFFVMPFAILFIMISIFLVFDNPLTENGQIYILVDSVIDNIGNFEKVLFFWKRIAKKIKRKLKIGGYKVSQNDLVVYFSRKLLETNYDLTNDLICFRNWLLGNQRSCYEALTHILPKNKIKRQTGVSKSNKLSNRLERNWKITVEVTSFVGGVIAILTFVHVFFGLF